MDAEAACILCNWVNDIPWWLFGLGGLAAGAAAAAAGGFFGGSGSDGGFSGRGASGTWPEPRSPYWPDNSPIPDDVQYLQQTSVDPETWAPYWPGVSALPKNGMVSPYVYDDVADDIKVMYTQKEVEPITGLPIWYGSSRPTAAQVAGGRG